MLNRIEISEEVRAFLLSPSKMPTGILVGKEYYTLSDPIASGYKSVVWKAVDKFGRPRALKLAIFEDYQDRSFLEEVRRTAPLEQYESFARLIDAGLVQIEVPGSSGEFVGFVEEWIDGFTLEEYLRSADPEISSSFFVTYVDALTLALSALQANKLRHDDLHARNVMIASPPPGEIAGGYKVKIIDTGSLKPADQPLSKPKDDHRHFVDHLVAICNAIHSRRSMPVRERMFILEVEKLFASMLDEDPSVSLRDPAQIKHQFHLAMTRSNSAMANSAHQLRAPFEFLSAEHIADDRLLVEMFAKSCPWLEKVVSPDPCLLTGPRGCGKSTIFRWMSLKAHLHDAVANFDDFNLAGFYVSCATDLQNRFDWITTPDMAQAYSKEIVHYFNLLLTRQVVGTLDSMVGQEEQTNYWGYGASQERELQEFIYRHLETDSPFRIQGVGLTKQTLETIEREMFNSHSHMIKGQSIPSTLPATFLGDLSSFICKLMPRFEEKRIAFLIDDYSTHRLPAPVQHVLNRVIWERRASHIFKLSSEKHGAELTDPSGASADLARDMVEIDCGREYLALDDARKTRLGYSFAVELLNNRLKQAGYVGTAESLIGDSSWAEGTLAKALVNRQPGRQLDQYHGLDCVAAVCSGDVSTLLFIYRRMFESAGVNKDTTTRISKTIQSRSIRSVSRELLEAVNIYFPYGPEMYGIVASFGKLVRAILEQGREQKKGDTTVPSECPRIEIDQLEGHIVVQLSGHQQSIWKELVRRAIFIDMEPGLSRHGNVTTFRSQLRRVYLPAFGASLAKNTAIKEDSEWFRFFLTNPSEACQLELDKWPKEGSDGVQIRMMGIDGLGEEE
ncbi:MAG: protein kinase [Chloroflexi bacterium]|nr:protein kinase [Chloroflexota bacterium]